MRGNAAVGCGLKRFKWGFGDNMALEQLELTTGLNKIDYAIMLIQAWEPQDGYYLGFSGGKDSVALRHLCDKANVRYEAVYHPSPLDAPEQMRFIREYYPDTKWERPPVSFWKAFNQKSFPLRTKRWCCEYIKEWGGADRVCLFGLRSAESKSRTKRCYVSVDTHKTRFNKAPRAVILPILLWDDWDIWQYIKQERLPYCSLYDEGFDRIGCIMCPLASPQQRLKEYYRFPRIALAWYKAFERVYQLKYDNYSTTWASADDLFWWWMGQKKPERVNNNANL